MPVILCVANQKGGVGKTTTATCLAHALALTGRKILVVDVDSQANATSGMGLAPVPASPAFAGTAADGLAATAWSGVWAIPAGRDLERLAARGVASPLVLKANLERLPTPPFDAILIDCPPSLGIITQNALAAAHGVIVPIQSEYYPLEGLVQLLSAVRQAAQTNPALSVAGVLLTMFDPAADLSREVEVEVRTKLKEPVFRTVIPRDPAVAEAPSHCLSVLDYAPRSPGAKAYAELALEIIQMGLVK
jgi:chromosome partitioning protein